MQLQLQLGINCKITAMPEIQITDTKYSKILYKNSRILHQNKNDSGKLFVTHLVKWKQHPNINNWILSNSNSKKLAKANDAWAPHYYNSNKNWRKLK